MEVDKKYCDLSFEKSISLLIIKIEFEKEMLGGFSMGTVVANRIRNYINIR